MHHEAMADGDRKSWPEGVDSEIKQLEKMDCWDVIASPVQGNQASCAIDVGTQRQEIP